MKVEEFEVLALLSEECGETVQAIGKIFRHGLENGWDGVSNKENLEKEIADVLGAVQLILGMKDFLNHDAIYNRIVDKFWSGKINKYLHSFNTEDVLTYTFVVEFVVEEHYDVKSISLKTKNMEYVKQRVREYFDNNYLENVKILKISFMEDWIKANTMKEKR